MITRRPRTTWASPTASFRPGTGRPTWPGHRLLHRGAAVLYRRDRPGRLRARRRTTWASPTASFRPGTGRQPGPGDRLLYRGAAVLYRRDRPARLRQTQNNLGNAYAELPSGDRAANLARAIDCYAEALRFRTAEAAPLRLRHDPAQLGNAYAELPSGDRAANLAQAIDCYTEALRFCTAEAAPLDYAMTQHNLGSRLRRASVRGPGRQPGAGDRLLSPRHCGSIPPRPPRMTTRRPSTTWARLRRSSVRGPGGQPGAGDQLLHRGAAVPHRRGRPARLRRDPAQSGRRLR